MILCRKGWSCRSARALARELNFRVTTNPNFPVIINWGNSDCVNSILNQNIDTNKFRQLKLLKSKGIRVLEASRNALDLRFPVFCRQRNHQAGKDIVVCSDPEEVPTAYFYTQAEKFIRELRVHVINTNPLSTRVFVKEQESEDEYPIKNLENGAHFRLSGASESLERFLHNLLEASGMDFMCVDIGILQDREYCVIEYNSAPSLVNNENTLRFYAENLGRMLR